MTITIAVVSIFSEGEIQAERFRLFEEYIHSICQDVDIVRLGSKVALQNRRNYSLVLIDTGPSTQRTEEKEIRVTKAGSLVFLPNVIVKGDLQRLEQLYVLKTVYLNNSALIYETHCDVNGENKSYMKTILPGIIQEHFSENIKIVPSPASTTLIRLTLPPSPQTGRASGDASGRSLSELKLSPAVQLANFTFSQTTIPVAPHGQAPVLPTQATSLLTAPTQSSFLLLDQKRQAASSAPLPDPPAASAALPPPSQTVSAVPPPRPPAPLPISQPTSAVSSRPPAPLPTSQPTSAVPSRPPAPLPISQPTSAVSSRPPAPLPMSQPTSAVPSRPQVAFVAPPPAAAQSPVITVEDDDNLCCCKFF